MTSQTIAHALDAASETDKAELAQAIEDALLHLGLAGGGATKREIVAALDRFADAHRGRS